MYLSILSARISFLFLLPEQEKRRIVLNTIKIFFMGIVKKTTDEILYVSVKKLIPGLLIMIYLKKSHNEIDERRAQFLILKGTSKNYF
jgi:hypothetical protein